jgi:hypothetical protein
MGEDGSLEQISTTETPERKASDMSDSAYPLTSADRRDRAAIRQLKADVFEKRQHIHKPEGFAPGQNEGTVDMLFLWGLWAVSTPQGALRLITSSPVIDFEDMETVGTYFSRYYAEEIQRFKEISLRAWSRWHNRGMSWNEVRQMERHTLLVVWFEGTAFEPRML